MASVARSARANTAAVTRAVFIVFSLGCLGRDRPLGAVAAGNTRIPRPRRSTEKAGPLPSFEVSTGRALSGERRDGARHGTVPYRSHDAESLGFTSKSRA